MGRDARLVPPKSPEQSLAEYLQHLGHFRQCSPNTVQAYRTDLQSFLTWVGQNAPALRLPELTQPVLLRYLASLPPLSSNTVRRRVHALSGWLKFLVRQGILTQNPAEGLPLPRRERRAPRYPNVDDVRRIVGAAQTPLERAVICLLAGTGLRRAELAGLDLDDLSVELGELRVFGKGRRERFVPVPAFALDALRDYLALRGSAPGALLLNRAGHRLGFTSLRRLFERLLRRAGLSEAGYTLHAMRHAYATMLVRAGVDLSTIRDLLGHSDVAVTSVYLHSDLHSKRAAVEQLPVLGAMDGSGREHIPSSVRPTDRSDPVSGSHFAQFCAAEGHALPGSQAQGGEPRYGC